MRRGVHGVSGETGDLFGQDQVDLAGFRLLKHPMELGPVGDGSPRETFIGKDTGGNPPRLGLDVLGKVSTLGRQRMQLVFLVRGDPAVGGHPKAVTEGGDMGCLLAERRYGKRSMDGFLSLYAAAGGFTTSNRLSPGRRSQDFDPCSLCGERRTRGGKGIIKDTFQFTLSLRKATVLLSSPPVMWQRFQSTLSLRRATVGGCRYFCIIKNFIHALLAESDWGISLPVP